MKKKLKNSFFYKNSLSLVLLLLMITCLIGQFFTGFTTENKELAEEGLIPLTFIEYFNSGHFIQATFENWESEFLQMMLYVLLTISLRQKGSSESKSLTEAEAVDREPQPHRDAPWPVTKGGIFLKIYNHSLSLAFGILFLISFIMHFYGSFKDHNFEESMKGLPPIRWYEYLSESRF